jgi:large subunit ribosomal protein L25
MEKIKLNVKEREAKTPNQLRREAKIPATLYGAGENSKSLQVEEKEFLIELNLDAQAGVNALIRNVQTRASTSKVMNIEFYKVRLDRKITVTVPLKFIGASEAVIQGAQIVEVNLEADIECFPADIPDVIEVDLSLLKEIDQAIHYGDLKVSEKVEILNPHDEVIVKAIIPRIIEEPEVKPAIEGEGEAGAVPAEGEAGAAAPAAGAEGAAGKKPAGGEAAPGKKPGGSEGTPGKK